MKSLIVPIAVIVTLVVLFVIVDKREFNRHNDVQTVQSENTMVYRKPAVSVSRTKLAETNSVTKTKPVETKFISEAEPVAETKPAEIKPAAETKPAEIKLAAETKPEGRSVPVAVPVVTQEEAEKLNEFALFLSTVKKTVVEGEVLERSDLPDPRNLDYPNCRFTAHFMGNTITSGEPCPQEIALVVEGFENYRVLPNNNINTGDKVLCTIIPFEQLPEDYQSTQQADDLNLYLLTNYYVISIEKIASYSDNSFMPKSGIFFSSGNDEYISIFQKQINPTIPQDIKKSQLEFIKKDIQRMTDYLTEYDEATIKKINESFYEAWAKERKKDPEGYNRVLNKWQYVWRNVDSSFWCLPDDKYLLIPSSGPNVLTQNTLDCFIALKDACEANGVLFILSLVPDSFVISSRVINKDFRNIPDLQTAMFVKQLSSSGIETIYASQAIIDNYNRYPFAFYYPEDDHPSDTVQEIISDILSERLKEYNICCQQDSNLYSINTVPSKRNYPPRCDIGDNVEGDARLIKRILFQGQPVPKTKNAPIIVVGNSFIETPVGADSAQSDAFPSFLSYKTLSPVDWYRIGGYGPFSDILYQILLRPEFFFAGKKVFIMHVGTNHIKYINQNNLMLNIAEIDAERIVFNNKRLRASFQPTDQVLNDEPLKRAELWGKLADASMSVFSIEKEGENSLFSQKITGINAFDDIDNEKPILCVIPSTCARDSSCDLIINGVRKKVPCSNYIEHSRFFNLVFNLPPGTNEITVSAEGEKGTLFTIKDIQIWQ